MGGSPVLREIGAESIIHGNRLGAELGQRHALFSWQCCSKCSLSCILSIATDLTFCYVGPDKG